ncbi:hypothetical protein NIES4071_103470 (plasmid) [Calothrix sp. NIES-4071]|nr:hypothetical protein NIES4071_103470 [Calothrix sp. NIES-4071]BAZ64334.1 hypothetical protein NIES4105_100670 [Calothrix sp. NIES-4105]
MAEVKQLMRGLQEEHSAPQILDSVSPVVIVDEQVRQLASQLDVCSTIEEAYKVFVKVDPKER